MDESSRFLSRSVGGVAFPDADPDNNVINKVIIREIDIDISGDEIKIGYKNARVCKVADFDEFKNLITGDISVNNKYLKKHRLKMKQEFESHLSISSEENAFLVFVLSQKNWQFCSTGAPFTILQKIKDKKRYYSASMVDPKGNILPSGDEKNPVESSKVAFFVALGAKGKAEEPGGYSDPINIYVDIVEDNSGTIIPIVIDPDIRYPGGSTIAEEIVT